MAYLIALPQEIKFPLSYLRFAGETVQIDETSFSCLDSLAKFLELTGAKIEIGSHTDNVGTPAEKQKLSLVKIVTCTLRAKPNPKLT